MQAINDDLQVKLAHARDNGLTGLLIGMHPEGWVFLSQTLQANRHLLLVGLGLRLDSDRHRWLNEANPLKLDGVSLVAQCTTGSGVLESDHCRNITRFDFLDLVTLLSKHPDDAPDPLFLAGG